MATLRKRNGKWQVQIRRHGFKPISRTFTSKSDAQTWCRYKEGELDRSDLPSDPKALERITWKELLIKYRDTVVINKKCCKSETAHINAYLARDTQTTALSIANIRAHHFISYRNCRLALRTGMRKGEILNLKWEHIDLKRRVLHIPETKNGHSRDIPLCSRSIRVLKSIDQSTHKVFSSTANAVTLSWKRLLKRSRVTNLKFHDLRHEAISRFFELGLSVPEVALISGHKDYRMLFRYTHMKAESVAEKLR